MGAMDSDDPPRTQEMRRRASDLHLALVADKEVVRELAQWAIGQVRIESLYGVGILV